MNHELIIIEDGECLEQSSIKMQNNFETQEKTESSLETTCFQKEVKLEEKKNLGLKLNIKRLRAKNEKTQKTSEKKKIKLSSKKKSSLKKKKNIMPLLSINNESKQSKLSEIPKYSDISSNSTFDNLNKELKGKTENKFSILNANSEHIKTSFEQFTQNNNNIKNFAIKKIKLSIDKLKSNKDKDSQRENLNLFEILKENQIDPYKEDLVMIDISKNLENDKIRKEEFVTPNKVNFYEEHCKRFYKNDPSLLDVNSNQENANINQKKLIDQSPFKSVSIPQGFPNSSDCLYLYSHMSKALILVGFFGIVILYLQDNSINSSVSEVINNLINYWKTNLMIIVSLAIMIYYFNNKLDNSEELYRESAARMILENMKVVLESEKTNNPDIYITENDIVVYFSYQLKLNEEYIIKNIIPSIRKLADNEKCLVEEKEIINERESSKWRLSSS